jgi:transcriptional regulator with XRE-family HTH domain
MTITATQLRIGRGLLGWSRSKLAVASNVGVQIIKGFEDDTRRPSRDAIARWRRALESAGVTFVLGSKSGVSLNAARAETEEA